MSVLMSAYLTFDIGTTALKTALISDEGKLLALHVEEYAFDSPRPDWAEMAPEAYWRAAVVGAHSVMAASDIAPSRIAAIGFSSQGQTFVPIDAEGRPLYSAIVWTDNRAQSIAEEWERTWLPREEFRRISGYPCLSAALTVFKVAWLTSAIGGDLKSRPVAVGDVWKFLCLPDYLIWRMTGETVTDHVTAQFSGFYDLRSGDWEPKLLEAAGITVDRLPTVAKSGSIAGKVANNAASELGVLPGTAVCVGANDQICGAVGAGNAVPGIVTETTGTALAVVATTASLLDDTRMLVGRHADPDLYFALPFGTTSAIVLKWLRDLSAPGACYDHFLSGVELIPPGCEGLTVLPHFAGTSSPWFNPRARGVFAGLSLGHTRLHMARAVMESCACMLKELVGLIVEHGVSVESVRSLGGAARSDVWLQIKADMLATPVEKPECADAASLGAAMLAAVGIGQFSSIEEASNAWYRPAGNFKPDRRRVDAYSQVFRRYLELYDKLYAS